jgi:DNA topoisomerase-1
VLNGRVCPNIVAGKKNVKIPKGEEPTELTLERCLELAAATPDKPAKGGRFGKKAAAAPEKEADAPAKKAAKAPKEPAAKKKAPAKKPAAAKAPAAKKAVAKK